MEELLNCRLSVCQGREESQQMLQERFAMQNNQLRKQKKVTQLAQPTYQQKEVFSFRNQQLRHLPPTDKQSTRHAPLSQQIYAPPPTAHPTFNRIPHSPQPQTHNTHNPRVRFFHSPPPTSLFTPAHPPSQHLPRARPMQRSAIYDPPSAICEAQLQRLTLKHLRASEQETEYSSKQSQIGPRMGLDVFQGGEHPRRIVCGRTKTAFLQLSSESSKSLAFANKLTHSDYLLAHPHCNPVAPTPPTHPQPQTPLSFIRRQMPFSAYKCSQNEELKDTQSQKTLFLVKQSQGLELNGKGNESGEWEKEESRGLEDSVVEGDETSRTLIDCFKEQSYLEGQESHQIHFETSNQSSEPSYSFHEELSPQHSPQFPQSYNNSSIKIIVDKEKQRKKVTFQPQTSFNSNATLPDSEPQHDSISPFARANIRHTTTIQSFGSHSSNISCLDIHFMQRIDGGRAVTRLT